MSWNDNERILDIGSGSGDVTVTLISQVTARRATRHLVRGGLGENFFADSKSRAQELSHDVSFVIFGHQTWDLEGGVKLTPPQRILVFKYPSGDRVKFRALIPLIIS